MITTTVTVVLLIKSGICKTLNNSIKPKNSTIIVNKRAEKNLNISMIICFGVDAVELKTSFLFVM